MGVEITGIRQMVARLRAISREVKPQLADAVRAEAEIEMTEAKRRTPVDTGALRSSGQVSMELDGKSVGAALSFGGPSAPYALEVHENLEAFHRIGQAKYLESTLNESAPYLAKRIANRLHLK